jgi:hypothetical protein
MLCFVQLLQCLLLICVRWVFAWYVALCVYHLFVFVCLVFLLVEGLFLNLHYLDFRTVHVATLTLLKTNSCTFL